MANLSSFSDEVLTMGVNQEKEAVLGEVRYGPFMIVPAACTVEGEGRTSHLEPKVMDLLCVLASQPGQVFTKDDLFAKVWPKVTVGEDTLTRAISKLRRSLNDDARNPRFLETVSKRGYRLIASPEPRAVEAPAPPRRPLIPERWRPRPWVIAAAVLVLAVSAVPAAGLLNRPASLDKPNELVSMIEKADDAYFQYRFAENETAIELYQRSIRHDPSNVRAHAGLANALVQRVMRWPQGDAPGARTFTKLEDALKAGFVDQPKAQQVLRRAMRMAQRAVQLNPRDAAAQKALAFVNSARRDFDGALSGYKLAVSLDPDAWGPMINIGDILEIQGRAAEAVPYFEKAYVTMTRVYGAQTVRVRPWHSELGIHIGDAYRARGQLKQSAQWYRKVLDSAPLHPAATGRLAGVLQQSGDEVTARELCAALKSRLGASADCSS
jgi:DNA-binding winged helix-turn-helix (wHTH) protein/Tfp pilus assembly protein PilF